MAKRRRIEITRERWTRISFPTSPWCDACNRPAELIPIGEAAVQARVTSAEVEWAVASGSLQVWTAGEHCWVCLHCISHLERNKEDA